MHVRQPAGWPSDGGTVGALVRMHDWSSTPIGPIEGWSRALRIMASAVFDSHFPQCLMWGPQLVQIYNDGYKAILGGRHPAALGQRGEECWHDIWPEIGPRIRRVMATGESIFDENRPYILVSDGTVEKRHFSYGWSPCKDEDGVIRGVLITVMETTLQLRAQAENERLLAESRANEERLRLAMQSPMLGTWELDAATSVVRWSDNALRLFGYTVEHRIDYSEPIARIHPEHRANTVAAVAAALDPASDGGYEDHYRVVWPDGSIRWIRSVGQAEFAERGGVRCGVRLSGVLWDVTEQQQLIETLRASEERARLALEAARLGAWKHDLASGTMQLDELARSHYGFDRDTVSFEEVLSRIHPDDHAALRAVGKAALDPASKEPVAIEYRVVDETAGVRWLSIFGRVHFEVVDGTERAVRNVGTVQDVTARRHAEEALRENQRRLNAVLNNASVAILVMDQRQHCVYMNPAAEKLTGYSLADMQGRPVHDVVHHTRPDGRPYPISECPIDRVLPQNNQEQGEEMFVHRDGTFYPVAFTGSPIRDEASLVIGTIVELRDIRRERQTLDALREADRAKDEFLAMLAHELRNPLAPIRTAFALFDREPLTERGKQALRMSQRQLRQLTRLVDDLLEASRVTLGRIDLRPEPVMVQQIVYNVAEGMTATLDERRQRIDFDMPRHLVRLTADPARVAQIVENLLANSSKYTDPEGRITVRVRESAVEVEIEVEDTGIGIAPQNLPKLFHLFTQIDTAIDRSRGGLGIGLALVKRLAELHGGSVSAHSDGPGQGARFNVRLPRQAAAQPPEQVVRERYNVPKR
jgi:PAS domain S-box-containing protein